MKRILVLGGGFAGLYAALEFERRLGRDRDVEVTLVSRENFHLFTPMLHEVAASDLDLTHIVNPIRKLLRRVRLFVGSVERLDLAARHVIVSHGDEHHHHELSYDHLVIALGSITHFGSLAGLEGRALTMKTLGDAIFLRNHLIEALEEADFECSAGVRDPLLTTVVTGGGFAGVETLAAIHDFVHEALVFYPHLEARQVRMVLVHSGPVILPELGEKLGRYAQRKLAERGVELRLGTRVASVGADGVTLADGTRIPTRTLVWTAGSAPNPLLAELPCAKERGRILVDSAMRVPGWPGVWALGDCALVPDRHGGFCPPTAQHALRQGKVLARNVVAALCGAPPQPFAFSALGQLAAIGKRTGVARILGINFSGFVAWWLWRTIYLAKLPRFEKKLRVMLDWSLDLVFSKDLVQFMTHRAKEAAHAGDVTNVLDPAPISAGPPMGEFPGAEAAPNAVPSAPVAAG
ncbi:MAG TPA: NAD(P)/FAD-dependent oxidoreductase [Candidatus Eisenbacteria bacterium]